MDKANDIKLEFEKYCKTLEAKNQIRFPKFKITTELSHPDVPALDTPEHLSVVSLIKELTGIDSLETVAYAAEAGQFSEAGFETVICGPGSIAQAHRANEYIEKDQMNKGVEFIFKLIKSLS